MFNRRYIFIHGCFFQPVMLVLGGVPSEFPKAFLEVEKHIPSSSQTYPSGRKLTIAPNLSK